MARSADGGVEPDERDAGHRRDHRDRGDAPRVETVTMRPQQQRQIGREQDEQAAAVCAEAASGDSYDSERRDRGAAPAEQGRAEQRREEKERREQVRDAVEAPGLRRAEGRERDSFGIEPERDEVGGEHGAAREAEGKHDRREPDERDGPPAGEPEVRGERERGSRAAPDAARRRRRCRRARRRGSISGAMVVPLDPALETFERRDRVVDRTTSSLPCATSASETRPSIRVESDVRTPALPGTIAIG